MRQNIEEAHSFLLKAYDELYGPEADDEDEPEHSPHTFLKVTAVAATIAALCLAAFVWRLSPFWVYFFLRIEFPLKGIVCFIRYCTGKWVKEIRA